MNVLNKPSSTIGHPRLIPIPTRIANLHLIVGERPILVDTGNPGNSKLVCAALARHGLQAKDLALILLTHAHGDHVGSVHEFRAISKAPIALHHADLKMAKSGQQQLNPVTTLGRLTQPFFATSFKAFQPDIVLHGNENLEDFGVQARLVPTPGHTRGSISIITSAGDAIIGDVLRGDFVFSNLPRPHFFCDHPNTNRHSIQTLLGLPLKRLFTGHGKPFSATTFQQRFSNTQGAL